jgi:HAD superfamily hydrolase (TIGR01509 family)
MIRGLIFDFDGLIIDSETTDYQAWMELFASHHCALPIDTWKACIGMGAGEFDVYGLLESQAGRPLDRTALRAWHRRRNVELLATRPTLPGVGAYIAEARRLGMKLAVASSSSHAWVDSHLDRLGHLCDFDAIRCRDDVLRAKPAPGLYLAALAALGLDAAEVIAFEDSINGSLAAKRADLCCVAVPNTFMRTDDFSHVDLRLDSLADVPLAQLLERVAAKQERAFQ